MQFFKMAWLDFKGQRAAFNLEEFLLLETGYPFLTLVFYCVMAGFAYDTTDIAGWVVGNAFLLCTNICIFSLGNSFMGERYYGRIRSIIVGELSKIQIILQKGFFSSLISVVTTLAGFGLGCVVFSISFVGIPWGALLVILLFAMFAAASFGLFLSTLGLMFHQMHFVLNLMSYVLLLFTGSNFPVEQLPKAGQVISYLLPLTRSIEAAKGAMAGMSLPEFGELLLGEFLVGSVYVLLAVFVVKKAEQIAIQKGTMELF